MIYFSACPKCRGDLTVGQDSYGSFISCLQCGFMRDIETKPAPVKMPAVRAGWYADEEPEPLAKAA